MKVTLLGLGKMGTALAHRLLEEGVDLTVHNRSPEKMEPFPKRGSSIEEACKDADLILTSLLDDGALKATLPKIPEGTLHISLSTILPKTAAALPGKALGGAVLGIPAVAREGKLTTYISGPIEHYEFAESTLNTISDKLIYLGPNLKSASALKVATNYTLLITLEIIGELYAFAEGEGLDKSLISTMLHQVYAHPGFKRYIDKIAEQDYDTVNFDVKGGSKDAHLFCEAITQAGITPELGLILKSRFQKALESGLQDKDWCAIASLIEKP